MEDLKKKIDQGLSAWPKRPIEMRSSKNPPATLPLAPTSFQLWKKPCVMTPGAGSSGTNKSFVKLSDQNSKNPFPPSDKNPTPLDLFTPAARDDNNPADKTHQVVNDAQIDADSKLKRIISNRASARKSRLKKVQYVIDMEAKVKALEDELAVLAPQVALYRSRNNFLERERKRLNMEISARKDDNAIKDAEIAKNKAEVNRLRKLHLLQNQKKMQAVQTMMMPAWEPLFDRLVKPNLVQSGLQQKVYKNSIKGWESSMRTMNPSWRKDELPTLKRKDNVDSNQDGIEQKLSFGLKPVDKKLHNFLQ